MNPARRAALAAALSCPLGLALGAPAESVYVVEQVVVNVNSAPDASGERIATVKSGDRLDVIEHSGDQVHVRLPGHRDGWIRASYLTSDEPLKVRLSERDAQLAQAQEQVTQLQSQLAASRNAPPGLAAPATAGTATPASAAADANNMDAPPLFSPDTVPATHRVWPWALLSAAIGLGAGFVLGALLLDRHIRRKYGGLRIY